MKISTPHPSSMLVGAALAGLVLFVLGAQQVASVTRLMLPGPVVVVTSPTPAQMVHVLPGATYTVPTGKIFVATGVAPTVGAGSTYTSVRFDGVAVVLFPAVIVSSTTAIGSPVISPIPPGLSAPAGTAISTQNGTLLGYLADA